MAPDRKAARQQRLRGAQTREPQDINFAFTLPAPPPRTTRSAVTPSSSRRAIPTRGRGSSSSRRSGSTRKRVEQKTPSDSRAEKRQRIEVAETSAKTPERDIGEDELSSINPVAQLGEEVTESPRNAPGSGRRQHFSSDPAERATPTKLKTPRDTTRRKSVRVVPSPELDAVEEVDELPRVREEVDELFREEIDELSPRIREEIDELSPDQSRIRPEEGELGSGSAMKLSRRRLDTIEAAKTPSTNAAKKRRRRTAPDELEAAETPIDATKKRRRRSDHEQPDELEEAGTSSTKKRRRNDHEEPDELEGARDMPASTAKKRGGRVEAEETPSAAKQAKTRRRRSTLDQVTEPEEAGEISTADAAVPQRRRSALDHATEAEEAEEISAADAAKKLVSKRRRRSSPAAEQRPPTKPSPAKQRAPKKRKPAGAKRGGAVPVTAYRMTRHDSDSGDDILNRAVPFASRSGVNAVDVLSQACDEFSVSAIEALGRGLEGAETSAERREYRTKLLAVEAFAEEARWKLMELTIAVDGEYAVRKRVRAVVKEKGELRARLMQLRAEREAVALQMDAARIRHEEEGKENETLVSLSTTMHDVSLATALGRDTTTDDSLAGPPLPVVIDEVAAMA
ncbi:hypothetical protein V494_05742, partial [Pseudogymnoascus sp. VKM F-4513 (FW-928)]